MTDQYLESVSLSNTHLGKSSGDAQRDCVAVAAAVSKMLTLKNLDLSANYFRIAGCKALLSVPFMGTRMRK